MNSVLILQYIFSFFNPSKITNYSCHLRTILPDSAFFFFFIKGKTVWTWSSVYIQALSTKQQTKPFFFFCFCEKNSILSGKKTFVFSQGSLSMSMSQIETLTGGSIYIRVSTPIHSKEIIFFIIFILLRSQQLIITIK